MSITTVGDYLIHYEALGRGEPLVFLHGWLGSWRYWWPSMQELSMRHRTFAFDLWGYGDSSKATNKYSFPSYVEMLDNFLEKLGIAKPVILVGHALGAAVSLRYTTQYPQNVKRLITVSLPVQGSYIHDRLLNTDSVTFISKVLGKANTYPEVEGETRKTDAVAMQAVANEMMGYNFAVDLDNCPVPMLMVFGNQDAVIQQPTGDYHHLQRPGNNRYYVSLDGCNHFPMLEQTAKFNRLLLDFIHTENNLADIAPKDHWTRRTR
jgi:pimeloyl-ACP methyl ester carboxylesterase